MDNFPIEETGVAVVEQTIIPEIMNQEVPEEQAQSPSQNSSPLSCEESLELQKLERQIEDGFLHLSVMNHALLTIMEKRLYRERYGSFAEYCLQVWHLCYRRVKQIIDGAQVIRNLNPGSLLPDNEKQTRPLTCLSSEDQRIVWEILLKEKKGKKPSGREVAEAVNAHLKKSQATKISIRIEDFQRLLRIAGKEDIELLRELAVKFKEASPAYRIFSARISTLEKEGTDNG